MIRVTSGIARIMQIGRVNTTVRMQSWCFGTLPQNDIVYAERRCRPVVRLSRVVGGDGVVTMALAESVGLVVDGWGGILLVVGWHLVWKIFLTIHLEI